MAYKPFKNKSVIYEVYNGNRKLFQTISLTTAKKEAQQRAKRLKSKKFFITIKKVSLVGNYSKE